MLSQGRSRQVVSPKRVMIRLPYRDSKKMAEEMQGLTRVSCQEGVCIIQLSGCINEKKNILRSGRLFLNGRLCSTKTLSPHVRASKTSWTSWTSILDSTLWIPDSRYQIPVWDSGTWILDSNRQWDSGFPGLYSGFLQLYSGFHTQIRIPQAKISHIPESGFLNMGRTLTLPLFSHFLCHNQQG